MITSAISSGKPGRPARAIFLATRSPNAAVKSSRMPVLTAAGLTEFIRKPRAIIASVSATVCAMTASFERL